MSNSVLNKDVKKKDNTERNIFIGFGIFFVLLIASVAIATIYEDMILLPMYIVAGIAIIGTIRRFIMMGLKQRKKRSKIDNYFDCI